MASGWTTRRCHLRFVHEVSATPSLSSCRVEPSPTPSKWLGSHSSGPSIPPRAADDKSDNKETPSIQRGPTGSHCMLRQTISFGCASDKFIKELTTPWEVAGLLDAVGREDPKNSQQPASQEPNGDDVVPLWRPRLSTARQSPIQLTHSVEMMA